MKKFMALSAVLLGSYAMAEPDLFAHNALAKITLCGTSGFVDMGDDASKWLGKDFASTLDQKIINRLTAYRIKGSSKCSTGNSRFLGLKIETTKSEDATKAFNINLKVYNFDAKTFFQIVSWHDYSFGYSQKSVSDSRIYIENAAMDLIDSFAADYAKANP